jgi:hypothetical protein
MRALMSEGTKSLLFGCHNFLMHPLAVLIAWHGHYGRFPKPWQVCCIFIHDLGIFGRQYLSEPGSKKGHWRRGARLAFRMFGKKGYLFIAGHTSESGFRHSELLIADKKSWLVAPMWWLKANTLIEGFTVTPHQWQEAVRKQLEAGGIDSCHELYVATMGRPSQAA